MTYVPLQQGGELATKADVGEVRDDLRRLEDRFDRLDDRFDRLEGRFDNLQSTLQVQFRSYTFVTIGSVTALTGIFAAVVSILR
jgi:predicted nuclease with TOPRIM domain